MTTPEQVHRREVIKLQEQNLHFQNEKLKKIVRCELSMEKGKKKSRRKGTDSLSISKSKSQKTSFDAGRHKCKRIKMNKTHPFENEFDDSEPLKVQKSKIQEE